MDPYTSSMEMDMSRIEDNRVMFLFHDEADALDAKDFFIEQDRTTGAENLP